MEHRAGRGMPWWRHRWVVAGAAILLVLGLGWRLARHPDIGGHLSGHVAHSGMLDERHFASEVPGGYVDATMYTDVVRQTPSGEEVKAPEGTIYVEVDWQPHVLEAPVWPAPSRTRHTAPGADLILVSLGRHYTVASRVTATDAPSSTVVLVDGVAADAEMHVRFGGRTVRAILRSEDAHGPPSDSVRHVPCSGFDEARVHCTLEVYRSGYIEGLGVAPDGKDWVLVHDSGITRGRGGVIVFGHEGRAIYRPAGEPTVTVTVDGLGAPGRVAGEDTVVGDDVHLAARAWLVPHGRVSVHLRYRLPTRLDHTEGAVSEAPTTRVVERTSSVTYRG